jgi:hypothetical protein
MHHHREHRHTIWPHMPLVPNLCHPCCHILCDVSTHCSRQSTERCLGLCALCSGTDVGNIFSSSLETQTFFRICTQCSCGSCSTTGHRSSAAMQTLPTLHPQPVCCHAPAGHLVAPPASSLAGSTTVAAPAPRTHIVCRGGL